MLLLLLQLPNWYVVPDTFNYDDYVGWTGNDLIRAGIFREARLFKLRVLRGQHGIEAVLPLLAQSPWLESRVNSNPMLNCSCKRFRGCSIEQNLPSKSSKGKGPKQREQS